MPPCYGDRLQIGQVFSNLFDNALKYFDTERSGVVRVTGEQTGRLVEYCVEDNGIGIMPEHHARVFQLFHRLHPSVTTGEGVGLTLEDYRSPRRASQAGIQAGGRQPILCIFTGQSRRRAMIIDDHLKRSGPVLLVEDNVAHAELIMAAASAIEPRPQMIHLIDGEAALEYIAGAQELNGCEGKLPSLVLLDL